MRSSNFDVVVEIIGSHFSLTGCICVHAEFGSAVVFNDVGHTAVGYRRHRRWFDIWLRWDARIKEMNDLLMNWGLKLFTS